MSPPPDCREKLPEKMTAEKALLGAAGMVRMGVVGLVISVGFFWFFLRMVERDDPRVMVLVILGLLLSFFWWVVFRCGQERPRQQHSWSGIEYQEKFNRPTVDSSGGAESPSRLGSDPKARKQITEPRSHPTTASH